MNGPAKLGAGNAKLASGGTVMLLMALTGMGQLGVNLALPALLSIGSDIGIAADRTGLVLSTYLIGLAIGQLVVGPLSDRFGRRPVLRVGLMLFTIGGAVSALAGNEPIFLGMRAVQGVGASAALALGRAMARDLFEGPKLVQVTTYITMAMAVVPGIAPAMGGVLTAGFGWRVALGFASLVGALMLLLAEVRLVETNRTPVDRLDGAGILRLYVTIIKSSAFRRNALSNTMVLAALYAFFAGAPRDLIGAGKLTPAQFGLVPVATSFAYVLGGWALVRLSDRPLARCRLLLGARAATIVGSSLLIVLQLVSLSGPWSITAGTSMYAVGLGALLPVGVAGALIPFKEEAGTASALLGALQMAGGALAGAVVGWLGFAPGLAFPIVMLAFVLGSTLVAPRRTAGTGIAA